MQVSRFSRGVVSRLPFKELLTVNVFSTHCQWTSNENACYSFLFPCDPSDDDRLIPGFEKIKF